MIHGVAISRASRYRAAIAKSRPPVRTSVSESEYSGTASLNRDVSGFRGGASVAKADFSQARRDLGDLCVVPFDADVARRARDLAEDDVTDSPSAGHLLDRLPVTVGDAVEVVLGTGILGGCSAHPGEPLG